MKTFISVAKRWFVVDGRHNIKLDEGLEMVCPDSFGVTQHEPRIAEVLTPWVGDEQTGYTQQLETDHAPFVIEDSAQQPNLIPDPNMGMARIECGAETLTAIEADSNYSVLWSESE